MSAVNIRTTPLIALLVLVAAACGSGGPAATTTTTPTTTTTTTAPTTTVALPEGTTVTESGLGYLEVEAGEGQPAEAGDIVEVHYTGTLEDGTVFDSSIARGVPFAFTLGEGQVIRGWDEGIGLMNVGGKAILTIPPSLAYGATGAGGVIPPNATLTFDVELVGIVPPPPDAPTDVDAAAITTMDSGLMFIDLETGEGDEVVSGNIVSVHYTGWLDDGTRFDSSLSRGAPFTFTVGVGQVIAGWDEGVVGMMPGTVRQLVIPADLAYGAAGRGGIPPDATLTFEVELISIDG